MLRIFTLVKIQRLRPGLNPQTWVPEASMLATRTPKPSRTGLSPRPGHYVSKVALWQIFLRVLQFSLLSIIPPVSHIHSFIHSFIHSSISDAIKFQQLAASWNKTHAQTVLRLQVLTAGMEVKLPFTYVLARVNDMTCRRHLYHWFWFKDFWPQIPLQIS